MITFSDAVKTVFHKYAEFGGRATRAEYWWWQLFYAITFLPLYVVGVILLVVGASANDVAGAVLGGFFVLVCLLWALAVLLPSLAVLVRRIRDAGLSPYLVFLGLIPSAGGIILLIFSLLPSQGPAGAKAGR